MFRRWESGTASPRGWDRFRRILCVRLDSMGDVLMTGPAIRALRGPGCRITLITSPGGAEVAALMPEIDEVLTHDAPWMKAPHPRLDPRPDEALIRRVHAGRFDAAVIFTVYSQSPFPAAMLCHLAGIPRRLAHAREKPYDLITDWVPDPEPADTVRHEVRRQLDLVAAVGRFTKDERLRLAIPPRAAREAADRLAGVDPARPWAVVHPGATASSRRWPEMHFVTTARRLSDGEGWQLVLTGSEEEVPLVERIRAAVGDAAWSLAGRLPLAVMAAVLRRAPLLIANNTGPVHVAAAVGTPCVVPYAMTNPQHTPWGVPAEVLWRNVPCRWCHASVCPEGHHRCLRLIHPDEVVTAALRLASRVSAPRPSVSGKRTPSAGRVRA